MAEGNVIWILIIVVLAIAVLAFTLGILGTSQKGIGATGPTQTANIDLLSGQNLYASCNDWLNSPNRYDAKKIVDTYKVPLRTEPFGTYGSLNKCSGTGQGEMYGEALAAITAGETNIDLSRGKGDGTAACLEICDFVVKCHDTIMQKHSSFDESQASSCLNKHVLSVPAGSRLTATGWKLSECGDGEGTRVSQDYWCP